MCVRVCRGDRLGKIEGEGEMEGIVDHFCYYHYCQPPRTLLMCYLSLLCFVFVFMTIVSIQIFMHFLIKSLLLKTALL